MRTTCRPSSLQRKYPDRPDLVPIHQSPHWNSRSGHTINIEEPNAFNAALAAVWAQVDSGRWPMRDPRAVSQSMTGITK